MGHKCSEDDCKRDCVSGPKTKCKKCNTLCYLLCYGFEKAKHNHVKIILPSGAKIAVDPKTLIFVCDNCDVLISNVIPKPGEKNDTTNGSELSPKRTKTASLAAEFREWSKTISSQVEQCKFVNRNEQCNEKHATKNMQQNNVQKSVPSINFKHTPSSNCASKPNVNKPQQRQFSTVLKSTITATAKNSAKSGKRKHSEITLIENSSATLIESAPIPSPRNGTGNFQIGKPVTKKPAKVPKSPKQRLDKSVGVSNFDIDTTVEEINEHILSVTTISDAKKFRCIKLIKKEQDLSKLSFVSFKIDVVSDHFDELMNRANWSSENLVREFVKMKLPEKSNPSIDKPNSASPCETHTAKSQRIFENANDLLGFNTPQSAKSHSNEQNFRTSPQPPQAT
ncbi:uncharacterized protein LOC129572670 [Sitodiplosis mosellana]|uniref:uncharacterized protein LOC129572670 n=1 Tax=Sitodiplosis mosellana TaxID=263140 RepID=UPI00244384FE|nr:uncharacterized protein LOC129572670 [Sitodiplosis mosellana]